jgi:hypothetical protein
MFSQSSFGLELAKVDLGVRSKQTCGHFVVSNLVTGTQETAMQVSDSFTAASSLGLGVV